MFVVNSASVVGDSHTSSGKGNEDSLFVGRGSSGWLSCVVSDGCGSAKHAATGSKLIAELVGESLLRVSTRIDQKGVGGWITDDIISELANCKNKLRDVVGSEIQHYHATVVAALVSPKGGFLLHIGDGIATSLNINSIAGQTVEITQGVTSEPENGEYANETFYLTEPSWIRHFRITPLPRVDLVMLCTDGAQDVFFDRNVINPHQAQIILGAIKDRASSANAMLRDHLLGDDARKRSSDDKTLALICTDQVAASLKSAKTINFNPLAPSQSQPSKAPPARSPKAIQQEQQNARLAGSQNNNGSTAPTQAAQPLKPSQSNYLLPMAAFALFIVGIGTGFGIATALRPIEKVAATDHSPPPKDASTPAEAAESKTPDTVPEKVIPRPSAPDTTPSNICIRC